MPAYHPTFVSGMGVRIGDTRVIREASQFHPLPLIPDLLTYAGVQTSIMETSFYHGGFVLHTLRSVPGYWSEEALSDIALENPDQYPRPSDYFVVEARNTAHGQYVVISDKMGVECLKVRCVDSGMERDAILKVASKLHLSSFESRYAFFGTFG